MKNLSENDLSTLLMFDFKIKYLMSSLENIDLKKKNKTHEANEKIREIQNTLINEHRHMDGNSKELVSELTKEKKDYDKFKEDLTGRYKLKWNFNEGSFDDKSGQLFPPEG